MKFKTQIIVNGVKIKTREYIMWLGMMQRVGNAVGKYANCTISENFKDFQFFAKWCHAQIGWNDLEQFQLDKDFLIDGNTEYGEDSCCLIPILINNLFSNSLRGDDTGAVWLKQCRRWQARCSRFGKQYSYGTFKTKEEAIEVYKKKKSEYVEELASIYCGRVRQEVYEKLKNFVNKK